MYKIKLKRINQIVGFIVNIKQGLSSWVTGHGFN